MTSVEAVVAVTLSSSDAVDTHAAEEFACPQCLQIVSDPFSANCAGCHMFCRPCGESLLDGNLPCPSCREGFTHLGHPPAQVTKLLETMRWHCVHRDTGCSFIGRRKELTNHLRMECKKQIVTCNFPECGVKLKREELGIHKNSCRYRPVLCDFCRKSISFAAEEKHLEDCVGYPVECPNMCGEKPARGKMDHHLARECLEALVRCPVETCGVLMLPRKELEGHVTDPEATSEHISWMLKELGRLGEERDILSKEVEELRSDLDTRLVEKRNMQTEMLRLRDEEQKRTADVDSAHREAEMRIQRLEKANEELREQLQREREKDARTVIVRFSDFEARSLVAKGGEEMESTDFDFQGSRFFLRLQPDAPFTQMPLSSSSSSATTESQEAQPENLKFASLFLCRRDDYRQDLRFSVTVVRGETEKHFRWKNPRSRASWGELCFCLKEELMEAARRTEGKFLELRVRMSADGNLWS
uniref:RING-type domain-containing protein n=1 Tax=Chromera velia CCMP2878 TaxID=1169474 RepID=A0A0G4IFQ6_9ALVE|mmetsp:Transcript_27551/g.54055  ORF Transcript_27551/g.54055 Transcript_27551/m.54055 type:complete len:473 (+) Transcript_27551:220-1638(+)|eukprot:Cvel_14108.t1-p1 / transcript=Cvel_14108.t1 / gene=Cvel_14108 / organism=Chromera_velia_CCMP2878 / gene_product=TNF receptor-associated factor family protein, putative / transcript_product=TNF receptor-associated factor family protein, putative / location=Cvel_scaffold993:14164-16846(-) / protein_length=472 / sequence_SO=supercontig / SO=protein_coding / is_pseudo=false